MRQPETLHTKYRGVINSVGIDFMQCCLQLSPSNRSVIDSCYNHPYFNTDRLITKNYAGEQTCHQYYFAASKFIQRCGKWLESSHSLGEHNEINKT